MATFTSQPDAAAGQDARLYRDGDGSGSNWNYGAATELQVYAYDNSYARHLVIKFDLSALAGYQSITSATLSLWVGSSGMTNDYGTIRVGRILAANADWVEGTKNGASASAGEVTWAWQAYNSQRWAGDNGEDGGADAGCTVSGTDYAATLLGSRAKEALSTGDEFAITLTAAEVANMVDDNHGMVVFAVGGWAATSFYSSDHGTAAQRPKLVIEWEEGVTFIPGRIVVDRHRPLVKM